MGLNFEFRILNLEFEISRSPNIFERETGFGHRARARGSGDTAKNKNHISPQPHNIPLAAFIGDEPKACWYF